VETDGVQPVRGHRGAWEVVPAASLDASHATPVQPSAPGAQPPALRASAPQGGRLGGAISCHWLADQSGMSWSFISPKEQADR
jgi:hypothetical protein